MPPMSGNSLKERSKEMVSSNGKMGHTTKEILWTVNFKGLANTILQTLISNMRESFASERWKEKESRLGLMVEGTKEISRMVKKTVKEPFTGQVDRPILEVGGRGSNMASA